MPYLASGLQLADRSLGDDIPVVPLPDWEAVTVNVLFGLLALAGFLWALSIWVRERKKYALMMFIGAALSAFAEPLIDVMLQVAWADSGMTFVHAYGRVIPPYCFFGWILYFFPMGLWLIKRANTQEFNSMTAWWKMVADLLVKAFVFELIPIWRYWWQYFGADQPLMVWRLPMHWIFINTAALVFAATVVFTLQKFAFGYNDRYSPMYAIVYPMTLFGSYFMTNLPVGLALNAPTQNLTLTTLTALLTIALCMFKLRLCGYLVVNSTRTGRLSLLSPAELAAARG